LTGKLWENVTLAVQYAPVLQTQIQTCRLTSIALFSEFNFFHYTLFTYKLTIYGIIYISLPLKSIFSVFVNKTIGHLAFPA